MPPASLSIESAASFNKAVKHLFRHLREPRALRANPLIARLFETGILGDTCRGCDHAMLERVQQLVLRGANECCDADLAAGEDELAARRLAIITQQCLGQRPIQAVAAELGLSVAQCYRERAEICQKVARLIIEPHDRVPALDHFATLDEFELRRAVALRRAPCKMNQLLSEWERLVYAAPTPEQKIEALRAGAQVCLQFGNVNRATDAYMAARALFADQLEGAATSKRRVAQACIDFIGSRLAYHRAEAPLGVYLAQRAVSELEAVPSNAAGYVRELYVQSLFELGAALCNVGDHYRGYDYIERAEAKLHRIPLVSVQLGLRIRISLWYLRNHLLLSSKTWYPASQRQSALGRMFEQAYTSGFFEEAVAALIALAEHHAFAGNDCEAFRIARAALLLAAELPSERIRAQTSIQVGMVLMTTRYWLQARSSLPEDRSLQVCDGYHRRMFAYIAAERARRSEHFKEALDWAESQDDQAEFTALTLERRLTAASAAHALGQQLKAGNLIALTIPGIETFGSAPLMREAYMVAAKITKDPRFERQAHSLTELLAN